MRCLLIGLCLLGWGRGASAQTPTIAEVDTVGNYYVAETIPTPEGLVAETGGMDFLPDGRFIASFHRGEVLTYSPKTKTWKRFAEPPLAETGRTESWVRVSIEPRRIENARGGPRAQSTNILHAQPAPAGNPRFVCLHP